MSDFWTYYDKWQKARPDVFPNRHKGKDSVEDDPEMPQVVAFVQRYLARLARTNPDMSPDTAFSWTVSAVEEKFKAGQERDYSSAIRGMSNKRPGSGFHIYTPSGKETSELDDESEQEPEDDEAEIQRKAIEETAYHRAHAMNPNLPRKKFLADYHKEQERREAIRRSRG
jgi:hypothetical protein